MIEKKSTQNPKTPLSVVPDNFLESLPENLNGIRPMIESPDLVIRKAFRRALIVILVTIIVGSGAFFYARGKIIKLTDSLQVKQNLIYRTVRRSQTNADLLRIWQSIGPNYDKINDSLPSSGDLISYAGELDTIAKTANVTQSVKLQAPAVASGDQAANNASKGSSVDYTIELKGGLNQFIDYIDKLEKAPYFTQITNFTFTSTQNLDSESTASIGAKLYTYP